jgi:hypothetical protein
MNEGNWRLVLSLSLFAAGIICQSISGFMAMKHLPKEHNDAIRSAIDPSRAGIPRDARFAFDRAAWTHPKTRWWGAASLVFFISAPIVFWLTGSQ